MVCTARSSGHTLPLGRGVWLPLYLPDAESSQLWIVDSLGSTNFVAAVHSIVDRAMVGEAQQFTCKLITVHLASLP